MKGHGIYNFIVKAKNDLHRASNDYEFDRKYSLDKDAALQRANEKAYKAIQDLKLFVYLANRIEENEEADY